MSAGTPALHTLTFGFNPGDETRTQGSLIGRGVLITPPLFGPFCRSAGAQSTTQSWRADSLTPLPGLGIYLTVSALQAHIQDERANESPRSSKQPSASACTFSHQAAYVIWQNIGFAATNILHLTKQVCHRPIALAQSIFLVKPESFAHLVAYLYCENITHSTPDFGLVCETSLKMAMCLSLTAFGPVILRQFRPTLIAEVGSCWQ